MDDSPDGRRRHMQHSRPVFFSIAEHPCSVLDWQWIGRVPAPIRDLRR